MVGVLGNSDSLYPAPPHHSLIFFLLIFSMSKIKVFSEYNKLCILDITRVPQSIHPSMSLLQGKRINAVFFTELVLFLD